MADLNLFRAPKGSPNYNAFRTLAAGTIIALLLLLLPPPIMAFWDTYIRQRPWISSTIAIKPATPPYVAFIEDTVRARWPVSGTRRVWVEVDGSRICDAERHDSWSAKTIGRTWTFAAFTEGCEVPSVPFRICTAFLVETARGVPDASGPWCSEVYKP